MKKMMKLWAVVAAAAMGLTACQGNFDEQVGADVKNSVTVKFVAEEARTAVDTSGDTPLFSWDDDETFVVLEQTDALAESTSVSYAKVDGKATITAEFDENAGKDEYKYIAIYPESNYGYGETMGINEATLILPELQYMYSESSYDPNADLMVSWPVTTTAQPTEAQQLRFTRLAAVAEMSINNLTLAAGEEVESVEFTANGKALAGIITADLEDPHAFTVEDGVSTVSITNAPANKVYFTVLPTTLEAEDAYSVVVVTNKSVYIKQGVVAEGKSLAFEAGKVTRFGVNMTDALVTDKWKLVCDASTLKQGDVVAIVAKDYDKALSTKLYSNASETSTSAKRGLADVTKIGNYMVGGEDVQSLTLMTGVADGTFSFYDEARKKFLVSTSTSSTYLINQVYCDVNTSFAISIDGTTTAATITNTEGTYKGNLLRYNSNGYFVSNQNSSTVYKDVCVYRLEGAVGEIPVVDANVTIPASDKKVTIAEEGAQTATPIAEVVFNYVGDWTIAVSDNAEWLNVEYDAVNNCLTYTAEANAGTVRYAVATLTATLDDKTLALGEFNLVQKGAPQEISIAEFMTKGKDENVTYKLTGKITEATSSSSGTYKITDGTNVATITYLYTDSGSKVYGDDTIGLKVGDIVTLTTVVTSTTKGKGGSSTYHSIYKGHYSIAVSAGIAVDYTGGSVAIEVATSSNGSVTVPTAVEGAMEECDYATFSYDGGDSATVTFTSQNDTAYAREATVTFTYGLASASVTVQQGVNPANKIGWELVTDASTLAVGDEVIIVAKNADKAIACPTSTSVTSFPSATISKTGNVIYDVEEAGVQIFTLGAGNSEGTMSFDFTYKDGTGYRLYYSSGLKMRATSNAVNAATSWSIEINAEDGDATITSTRLIKFNDKGTNGGTFSVYASDKTQATADVNKICIYKKQVK